MPSLLRRALILSLLALGTAPASAQGPSLNFRWDQPFPEPLYLVACLPTQHSTSACPADGMALLPDPGLYTNLTLRTLGGPFQYRWQVEDMRAALVRQGMPAHAMYIFVVGSGGGTLGGFWMGARPVCTDMHAQGALSGEVTGSFSPGGARPEAMPVSEDAYSAYMDYHRQIAPDCERRRQATAAGIGPGPGPLGGGAEPNFEYDTRIRIHGVECFGGTRHPVYFDHFFLNGRFVGVDRAEYDRVRAQGAADGAFCGAWETSRQTFSR